MAKVQFQFPLFNAVYKTKHVSELKFNFKCAVYFIQIKNTFCINYKLYLILDMPLPLRIFAYLLIFQLILMYM